LQQVSTLYPAAIALASCLDVCDIYVGVDALLPSA
jgi:hypothetical protein